MPWFLPLAALVAAGGLHTAGELRRLDSPYRRVDTALMLLISLLPLAVWLLGQFAARSPRLP